MRSPGAPRPSRTASADGAAYVFGPDLVRDLSRLDGDGRVRRYQPEELTEQLTHEPTRRLLTEAGLPLGGTLFGVGHEPLRTMGQAHPDTFASTGSGTLTGRGHQHDLLAVGWWPHDLVVALDGATGRLELPDWYGKDRPSAYLNRDLSAAVPGGSSAGIRHEWAGGRLPHRWPPPAALRAASGSRCSRSKTRPA
ncbi:SUKH-4 family immunity protein [Streptomyces wuyuanensis]|uniref:SUKH-4 immunity protein n=1 Tax=Streptomyces wuyuanensis TaxID=1196353 RepID=A0A1G9YX91_9ACTN|nr:SUKH-4 family immunity protein [Streptomyces wuyuanensis]SDN13734.1 SUKH-4 immunity protein [Streptomyces wuyuanensis]